MNINLTKIARRITAVAAFSAAALGIADGSVSARTISTSGASATTVLTCAYDGAIVDYINNGYDYVKVWAYDSVFGWAGGSWKPTVASVGTTGLTVSAGSTYAIYVQFADWTGAGWSYGGEWVANSSRTNYWCNT
jgi:hypothetical protein